MNVFNVLRKKSCARVLCLYAIGCLSACGVATQTKQQESLSLLESVTENLEEQNQQLLRLREKLEAVQEQQEGFEQRMSSTVEKLEKTSSRAAHADAGVATNVAVTKPKASETATGLQVLGRVEWLWFAEQQRYFAAELDSALDLSIIYAGDVMRFERDGQPWVRFTLLRNEWPSVVEASLINADRQRYLGEKTEIKGYRVQLPVALGSFSDKSHFLVVERNRNYPQVVLGKNFLTDVALVDVSRKYLVKRRQALVAKEKHQHQEFKQSRAAFSSSTDSHSVTAP